MNYAIPFFISFILVVSMIFLNLFIAIILQSFEEANQKYTKCFTQDMVDNFREVWSFFDPDATGFISIKQFETFMIQLDKPLGWTLDEALNKRF